MKKMVHKMIRMPIRNANDEERITMHLEIQAELQVELRIHIHPTCLIGPGRASCSSKVAAALWAFRLEDFSSHALAKTVDEFQSICPDFGIESRVNQVKLFPSKKVLQYWTEPVQAPTPAVKSQQSHPHVDCDITDNEDAEREGNGTKLDFSDAEADDSNDVLIRLNRMMLNPGQAHMVNNAANTLEEFMPSYKHRAYQLKLVCDLCRTKRHKPRLLETCFSDRVGMVLRQAFKNFKGTVHRARFATTAFAIPHAQQVDRALRHGFVT